MECVTGHTVSRHDRGPLSLANELKLKIASSPALRLRSTQREVPHRKLLKVKHEIKAYRIWFFDSFFIGMQLCHSDGLPPDRDSAAHNYHYTIRSAHRYAYGACTGLYPTRMCIYS